MKQIIKKSTTITEMIVDDNNKTFIINRKYSVKSSTEPAEKSEYSRLSSEEDKLVGVKEWVIEKDKYFREEIAKEAEEYKKKNPFPKKEETTN